ncbi:hypothetical protein Clacol_009907 [Clathrus columnatus]|uniref:Fungal N-terminal domain-containing protein n=1 Tax=Clathrus columnatus TaxID=1419009 RepID=A0AAV5ALZ2_9AGAM|nr:hypothetical protein Clacol_009907 [Clathrus columnatus]
MSNIWRNHPFSPLSSQSRRSTLSTVGTGVNNVVDDPIWGNPFIQDAMQILDQLADVGKTVPFIAPAFVILKLIIEVEKSARDADSKCNDLLERIAFMTSHLLVLKNITVLPATRQVVDRVNEALKEAAALITTYRKQTRITRRLTLGNREKFSNCADKIKTCTNDLLMSLQIHQTSKLDILSRAIPTDLEDDAARTFIESHGSFDAVKASPELVAKFAEEQHIQMDDKAMEQLNSNYSDSIRQAEERLESILKDNVNAAVVDGLKGLAAQMNEAEAEQRLLCVQCKKEYRNSTNGPKSCSFHVAEYSSWNKNYPCCAGSVPCQFQSHRATHHCDYPYGPFFEYSTKILNYIDTRESWVTVEDVDLETDDLQIVSVDRLIRWVSRGDFIKEPTILIRVGRVWHTYPYFFDTFTVKELEAISKVVSLTRETLIYRSSDSADEFSMAEWVLSPDGDISGVRLTAKAMTSETPYIRICPINITTGSKSGDIVEVSNGGLKSYKPDRPYILPRNIRVGPELTDKPLRALRTDFKTRTSPELRVILKPLADPPLVANPQLAAFEIDYFEGGFSVFNNFAATSQNPISIASISATFRLVGETTYSPVSKFELLDAPNLPVTIDPRQSSPFKFRASIPRTEEDKKLQIRWWNRSFGARHRPLRLKITLKDVEDQECSLVMEYIYKPLSLAKKQAGDIEYFYMDDYEVLERYEVRIEKPADAVIQVGTLGLSVDGLKKIVYSAMKTGETEVQLDNNYNKEKGGGRCEWKAWALVDLSCRRVYAFKVMIIEGRLIPTKRFGCLGYVLCPEYGDAVDEIRPIQLAREKATLPNLQPYTEPKIISDDEVDEFTPEPPKPAIPNGTHATAQLLAVPDTLNQRLTSIDGSLSRIAAALEQIAFAMATPKNP